MTAADGPADFLTATAPASRWRQPNILLIVCVAIGVWLVLVPVAALLVTAFTEDTGLGFGAFTLDNFVEAYARRASCACSPTRSSTRSALPS